MKILSFFIVGLSLFSCKSGNNDPAPVADTTAAVSAAPDTNALMDDNKVAILDTLADDGHNAENSLDIAGKYTGILPCASCSGISTILFLKKDNTFELTEIYEDASPLTEKTKGDWKVENNTLSLDIKGNKDRELKYKVEENQLKQLDKSGKTISGTLAENYILKKKD